MPLISSFFSVYQPNTVSSSMTVLHTQRGHCFDYAILLASLLIGVGYDAYCVLGYASKEVCSMNLSRKTCPLLEDKPEVSVSVFSYGVLPYLAPFL